MTFLSSVLMVGTFCLTGKEEGDLPGWYAFGCPKDNDSGGIRKKRLGIVQIGLSKNHFVKATRSYLQLRRFKK